MQVKSQFSSKYFCIQLSVYIIYHDILDGQHNKSSILCHINPVDSVRLTIYFYTPFFFCEFN